jgi:glycosyltransferase involved in cell wall biosynthesis
MSRYRVAFLISALAGGGAERATVELARALDPERFDVTLILERRQEVFYEAPPHVTVEVLGVSRSRESLVPLARLLRRLRPHAVYAALPHLNALAVVAARAVVPRPRVISSVHNNHDVQFGQMHDGRAHRTVTPWVYRFSDAIVAVSSGVGRQVAATPGVRAGKVKVIYNPIDVPAIEREALRDVEHPWLDGHHEVLAAAGRLVGQKDYPMMLRAFAIVRRERAQARLMILGEGEDKEDLQTLATELGVADDVDFLGLQSNPFTYLGRADCFLLASRFEGFGMVIVEAMAAGTAVVSTDCPFGPAEILEDGRWGLLSPPGEADRFAEQILRLLSDDELRTRLATEGRTRARDFETARVAPQLADLLVSLTSP